MNNPKTKTNIGFLSALAMASALSTINVGASTNPVPTTPLTEVSGKAIQGMPTGWKSVATPKLFKSDLTGLLDLHEGDSIDLALPEGRVTFVTQSMTLSNGEVVWIGHHGETGSTTQAQVHFAGNGTVFGQIQTLRDTYTIDTNSLRDSIWLMSNKLSGIQPPPIDTDEALARVEASIQSKQASQVPQAFPASPFEMVLDPVRAAQGTRYSADTLVQDPEASSRVDLLVLYTDELSQEEADKYLHQQIVYANQAYVNSQIKMRLRLVHVEPVHLQSISKSNSDYMGDLLDAAMDVDWWPNWLNGGKERFIQEKTVEFTHELDLYCVNNPGSSYCYDRPTSVQNKLSLTIAYEERQHVKTPEFDRMSELRNQYGADEVVIVTKMEDYGFCGMARSDETPGQSGYFDIHYMVAVVNAGLPCGTSLEVVSHEIGHTWGSGHLPGGDARGRKPYAHGFRGDSWSTIMDPYSGDVNILPYFSNPDIIACNGLPCGHLTTANDALYFNEIRFMAEELMPTVVADDGSDGTVFFQDPSKDMCSVDPNIRHEDTDLTAIPSSKPEAQAMVRILRVSSAQCNKKLAIFKKSELKKIRRETKGNPAQFKARKMEMKLIVANTKTAFVQPRIIRIDEIKWMIRTGNYH